MNEPLSNQLTASILHEIDKRNTRCYLKLLEVSRMILCLLAHLDDGRDDGAAMECRRAQMVLGEVLELLEIP